MLCGTLCAAWPARAQDHPTLRVRDLEVMFQAGLETSFRTASPVEEGVDADWRRRRVRWRAATSASSTRCRTSSAILQQPVPDDAPGWLERLEREIDQLSSKSAASVVEDRLALFKYDAFVVDMARLTDLARSRSGYLLCQAADFTATG